MLPANVRLCAISVVAHGVPRKVNQRIFGVKPSALKRWCRYHRQNGTVWRSPERRNLHEDSCWLEQRLINALLMVARERPEALLREHSKLLQRIRDHPSGLWVNMCCSEATVDSHLRRMGFNRKRVLRIFQEANAVARRVHDRLRWRTGPIPIVSVDETHTDGGDFYRKYGRGLRRNRVRRWDRDPRSIPRTSTTMAVGSEGSILGHISAVCSDGGNGLTGADWRLFLQNLIPRLGVYRPGRPWHQQPPTCVLLYDDASIRDAAGDAFLTASGIPFLHLPPYSPDLQPVECVFNDLKVIIRNLIYGQPWLLDEPHLLQAMGAMFITRRQVIGQFDLVERTVTALIAE